MGEADAGSFLLAEAIEGVRALRLVPATLALDRTTCIYGRIRPGKAAAVGEIMRHLHEQAGQPPARG